jgi:molecular chaperone HscB
MDFRADHFALFGLNQAFRLDLSDLDSRYRDIQAQVHPDRFVNAGDAERRMSMQWATHANQAYLTLKKPAGAGQVPASPDWA